MSEAIHRQSGKVPVSGLLISLGVSLPTAAALGASYGNLSYDAEAGWRGLFLAFWFSTVILGIALGFGTSQLAHFAKIRNHAVTNLLVLAATGTALVSAFGFGIGVFEVVAGGLIAVSAYKSSRPGMSVFCEDCEQWTVFKPRVFITDRSRGLFQLIREGDVRGMAFLARAGASNSNHLAGHLHLCAGCDSSHLSLTAVGQVKHQAQAPTVSYSWFGLFQALNYDAANTVESTSQGEGAPIRITRAMAKALLDPQSVKLPTRSPAWGEAPRRKRRQRVLRARKAA